jgi:hypothetical protein
VQQVLHTTKSKEKTNIKQLAINPRLKFVVPLDPFHTEPI